MDQGRRQDAGGQQGRPRGTAQSVGSEPFELAADDSFGYHRRQVDEFLARARVAYEDGGGMRSGDIRHVTFDAVKGGYRADQVDDVLDRLEDALARSERERRIQAEGESAWISRVEASIEVLNGRLDRPAGERFRRPAPDAPGYDAVDVDGLCDRIAARFNDRRGEGAVTVDQLRRALFAEADAGAGYDEAQVDAFLDAVIDVLSVLD